MALPAKMFCPMFVYLVLTGAVDVEDVTGTGTVGAPVAPLVETQARRRAQLAAVEPRGLRLTPVTGSVITEEHPWLPRARVHPDGQAPAANWNGWSACSAPCGNSGTQTRTASGCGAPGPETQACNLFCHNGGTPLASSCSCPLDFWGTCCETLSAIAGRAFEPHSTRTVLSSPSLCDRKLAKGNVKRRESANVTLGSRRERRGSAQRASWSLSPLRLFGFEPVQNRHRHGESADNGDPTIYINERSKTQRSRERAASAVSTIKVIRAPKVGSKGRSECPRSAQWSQLAAARHRSDPDSRSWRCTD
ncbi:Hypp2156 [Branchiostoma lanceolatum]|uniref:Hypp2156 protein n=1 Tax=Branchiostoma lanceolatum TaxID=7740 RepID=A0A8K0EP20_BRALA|nr:Hypp2156 [Branchiostoma lanceolatum]